jgi:hypothetical protein
MPKITCPKTILPNSNSVGAQCDPPGMKQVGITQFEELCQRFDHHYFAFMAELCKKRDHHLKYRA